MSAVIMCAFEEADLPLFADSVDRWAENTASADAWDNLIALGCGALGVGQSRGGLGGSMAEIALVMQAIGRMAANLPYWSSIVVAAGIIEAADLDGRHDALLGAIADGAVRAALAHYEPAGGPDDEFINTSATIDEGLYRLTGAKSFVVDAPSATHLLVTATTETGLGLFLVDPHADGVSLHDFPTIDRRTAGDLTLRNVTAERIGDDATAALQFAGRRGLLGLCAEAVGVITTALAQIAAYMRDRQQFGVPLTSFQALQHRLADLLVLEMQAIAITRRALSAHDEGATDADELASAAKAFISRAVLAVTQGAIQLYGGMGVTEEMTIGAHLKRAHMIANLMGDADWHLNVLDRMEQAAG